MGGSAEGWERLARCENAVRRADALEKACGSQLIAMERRFTAIELACEVVLSQGAERDASHREQLLAGVTAANAVLGERFDATCNGCVDGMVAMVDALEERLEAIEEAADDHALTGAGCAARTRASRQRRCLDDFASLPSVDTHTCPGMRRPYVEDAIWDEQGVWLLGL